MMMYIPQLTMVQATSQKESGLLGSLCSSINLLSVPSL